jgi:hypothetical protein
MCTGRLRLAVERTARFEGAASPIEFVSTITAGPRPQATTPA